MRPGDGEEYVYSPVDVNTTLHCAVNNTNLLWRINEESFTGSGPVRRGIFIRTLEPILGKTASLMVVVGNNIIETNNDNISICCLSLEGITVRNACTTLIIYGMVLTSLRAL